MDDAYEYLYERNPVAAFQLLQSLEERCISLAAISGQGKQRVEFNEFAEGLRSINEQGYVIFYRQTSYGILVIRFLHHSRDIDQILNSDSYNEY